MARFLARSSRAQAGIRLFAGQEQHLAVGEPLAFGEHRFHFGEAQRARILGVAVAVKLGQVHDLNAHLFEHRDQVGSGPWSRVCLFLERRHGGCHVPVRGHRVIAGELGEVISIRVTQGVIQSALGVTGREEIKDSQALVGAGRGVEPGNPRTPSALGLADAKAETRLQASVVATEPDGAQVFGQVARRKELVRGWKASDRTRVGFGDQRAMTDGQMTIRRFVRDFLAPQIPLGVDPCKARLGGRRQQSQTCVIEDCTTIFRRVHDGLDVHQAASR